MAQFDRPYAIVNIAVSGTVFFTYLTLNDVMTLKSGLEVTQGHSNRYHSNAWVRFPIFAFHSMDLHHLREIKRHIGRKS